VNDEGRTRYRALVAPWTATVASVQRLDGRASRVVLERIDGYEPTLGDTVAVDVGGGQMRRYTVADATGSGLQFVGVLTGLGPATPWLESLVPGSTVAGRGPERPVLSPDGARGVVVFGDATAIGTALSVVRSVGVHVRVIIRSAVPMPDTTALLLESGCTSVSVVSATAVHEGDLAVVVDEWGSDGVGVVVVGEQAANHSVRTAAIALGISRERVATRTFWRPDRVGLE